MIDMQKTIIMLLTAILLVCIVGVVLIVSDDFDEAMDYYIDVQLYELYFLEDMDVALEEVDQLYTHVEAYFEGEVPEEDQAFVQAAEETISLLEDLEVRLDEVEIIDEELIDIHGMLLNSVYYYRMGVSELLTAYKDADYDKFISSSESIAAAYDNFIAWEESILGD